LRRGDVHRRLTRENPVTWSYGCEPIRSEPGVAAPARVEPTAAKIGPTKVEATAGIGSTEPAEIDIATGVITAAGG